MTPSEYTQELQTLVSTLKSELESATSASDIENLKTAYLGKKGSFAIASKKITEIPNEEKKAAGTLLNETKTELESLLSTAKTKQTKRRG